MASKHLSYEERLKIQEGLSQNKAIFAIAKSIFVENCHFRIALNAKKATRCFPKTISQCETHDTKREMPWVKARHYVSISQN